MNEIKQELERCMHTNNFLSKKTTNYLKEINKLQEENEALKFYQTQWREIGGRANLEHLLAENKKLKLQAMHVEPTKLQNKKLRECVESCQLWTEAPDEPCTFLMKIRDITCKTLKEIDNSEGE